MIPNVVLSHALVSSAALFVVIPLLLIWVWVVVDVFTRSDTRPWVRVVWLVVVTLYWPTLLIYILTKPVQGRLVDPQVIRMRDRQDSQDRLAMAVLEHEAGRLDGARFARLSERLRTEAGGPGTTDSR